MRVVHVSSRDSFPANGGMSSYISDLKGACPENWFFMHVGCNVLDETSDNYLSCCNHSRFTRQVHLHYRGNQFINFGHRIFCGSHRNKNFVEQLVQINPDIVHFHGGVELTQQANQVRGHGFKVVWSTHTAEFEKMARSLIGRKALKEFGRLADLWIFPSHYRAKKLEKLLIPSVIVQNGIDTSFFSRETVLENKQILIVTRDQPVKRIDLIEKVLLSTNLEGWKVIILAGRVTPKIRSLCDSLERAGIQAEAQTAQNRSEMKTALENSSIYLSMSDSEGSSMSLLEALAMNLWVVSTKTGGTEFVGDQGSLIEIGDWKQGAQTLSEAIHKIETVEPISTVSNSVRISLLRHIEKLGATYNEI
jgi:glycosyltransferase involved in cell wall biosynthesis